MARFSLQVSRREWLRLLSAGVLGCSSSGWLERLAVAAAKDPDRKRACILLWMNGGPAQTDTFDLKPGHANGGPFKEIATTVPGLSFSEHLPLLSKQAKHLALVRSMTSREGDHNRAAYYLRTGYRPEGAIQYPPLGALLSKELGGSEAALPGFVSIAPEMATSPATFTPGFLGPEYAPLIVGNQAAANRSMPDLDKVFRVQDIKPSSEIKQNRVDARVDLLKDFHEDFVATHPSVPALSHQAAYDRAVRLMRTRAAKAFDLDEEKPQLRDRFGRNLFGQGCLLARRLVERGVPFVEVTLNTAPGAPQAWDTHGQNFEQVKKLCEVLDPAWATLLEDLEQHGLLDTTLVVWMGEFGRTPRINQQQGRDHFPNAWSTVPVAAAGIKGRGRSTVRPSPTTAWAIKDGPVAVPDFLAIQNIGE